jgi:hypothetical protein
LALDPVPAELDAAKTEDALRSDEHELLKAIPADIQ